MSQPRSSPAERGTLRRSAGSATTLKASATATALEALGVRTDGIRVRPGRTPICILAYQPDGRCHCLYDPGLTALADLDEGQRALLAAAEAICVTVGPTKATWEALRLARPDAALVWAVKADPRAVPPDLAAALAARADVVVFSRARPSSPRKPSRLRTSRLAPLRIETRGREGVAYMQNGASASFPSIRSRQTISTGAGDTFVGGFLAAWMKTGDPETAIEAGAGAARALLLPRASATRRG